MNCDTGVAFAVRRDTLKSLAEMMGSALMSTGSAAALMPIWARLVGEVVAKHSRPVRWEGKTLVIRFDGPAWLSALETERASLLRKLISELGGSGKLTAIAYEL